MQSMTRTVGIPLEEVWVEKCITEGERKVEKDEEAGIARTWLRGILVYVNALCRG